MHKPLRYGDIVWAKLGTYRWWPGQICYMKDVPENILNMNFLMGQFPVYFFGSGNYQWLNKGRVFLWAEGDHLAHKPKGKKTKFHIGECITLHLSTFYLIFVYSRFGRSCNSF